MSGDIDELAANDDTGSRRGFLAAAGVGLLATACAPTSNPVTPGANPTVPPTTAPVAGVTTTMPPPSPSELQTIRHLASRATFGATPAVINRIRAVGAVKWVDEQLDPRLVPHAETRVAGLQTLKNNNAANDPIREEDNDRILAELDHATLLRAVYSQRQLYEVMCDFWTNHLNISRQAKWLTQLKTLDNESVIRPHALGKFSDLLTASAKSPAMLVYLDNYASDALSTSGVNENYGRELLELHTLGIVNGTAVYSEADVVSVAKVLSGWTINWDQGSERYSFRFGYWMHSREAISILGGAWTCPARPNWGDYNVNGQSDGESLIRFLARHRSTARYICLKLARRFVSDTPPMGLVDRLAGVYTANDTAIAPVLRELFRSPEFAASAGQKVKRPMDWLQSALRVTNAQIPNDAKGHSSNTLRTATRLLGQPPFERPSPDGWPDRAAVWSSSQGLLKRWECSGRLARNALTDPKSADRIVVDIRALLPNPLPPTAGTLVGALAESVCQITISGSDADTICNAIGKAPSLPASAIAGDDMVLQGVVGILLSHPRFQYR